MTKLVCLSVCLCLSDTTGRKLYTRIQDTVRWQISNFPVPGTVRNKCLFFKQMLFSLQQPKRTKTRISRVSKTHFPQIVQQQAYFLKKKKKERKKERKKREEKLGKFSLLGRLHTLLMFPFALPKSMCHTIMHRQKGKNALKMVYIE